MTLMANAKVYETMADVLQLTLYILAVVTTLLAVLNSIEANKVATLITAFRDAVAAAEIDAEVERRVRHQGLGLGLGLRSSA